MDRWLVIATGDHVDDLRNARDGILSSEAALADVSPALPIIRTLLMAFLVAPAIRLHSWRGYHQKSVSHLCDTPHLEQKT